VTPPLHKFNVDDRLQLIDSQTTGYGYDISGDNIYTVAHRDVCSNGSLVYGFKELEDEDAHWLYVDDRFRLATIDNWQKTIGD